MKYSHNKERAKKYAASSLKRIEQEQLAPTPENYELWYVYYAQMDTELVRAIDKLFAENKKISDTQCQKLYRKYLSDRREVDRVRSAGNKIRETIKNVGGVVTDVKSTTSKYNKTLSGINGALRDDMDTNEVRAVLNAVMDNTKNVILQNQHFEDELTKSSETMQRLQHDLELIRKEALTDSLTGLSNRRAFDSRITEMVEEAAKNKKAFSLIMIDIDHFKDFNDNFGHQVGDQVLRLVAKTLFDGVKGRDMVVRYGGEEFAILLPDTKIDDGMKVGEFLRKAVASKEIINRNSGKKLGRITLSGGIAEYVEGESGDHLIERADAALYAAKRNGRNQLVAAKNPTKKKRKSG